MSLLGLWGVCGVLTLCTGSVPGLVLFKSAVIFHGLFSRLQYSRVGSRAHKAATDIQRFGALTTHCRRSVLRVAGKDVCAFYVGFCRFLRHRKAARVKRVLVGMERVFLVLAKSWKVVQKKQVGTRYLCGWACVFLLPLVRLVRSLM